MIFATGQFVFVYRPECSFIGKVMAFYPGWVRVVGLGAHENTRFDEWFPIKSPKITVIPANNEHTN